MPHRRARPTLRVLKEDLASRLGDPALDRALENGDFTELQPLSELPHPILKKAAAAFGEDPAQDTCEGRVRCCSSIAVWEIKVEQWRAGVWIAEDGVCWVIACGLAKGDHADRDDFYQALERTESGPGAHTLKPTEGDIKLWKREVVGEALSVWERDVQTQAARGLTTALAKGSAQFDIAHPLSDRLQERERLMSTVTVEIATIREEDYDYDEVTVTFDSSSRWLGTDLEWQLVTRVLITIAPPEQGWDRFQNTYSNLAEPDSLAVRLQQLDELSEAGDLAESQPGDHAHHAHRRSLTDRTVNGHAVRALCGAFFVPIQDHDELPVCPACSRRIDELDRAVPE